MGTPTENYVNLLVQQPQFEVTGLFAVFFLGLFRIAPIVSIAPFLGSKLPGSVKIGLAITLTILFIPHILATSNPQTHFDYNMAFVAFGLKEIFIGVIIAFLAAIPFYIAESAGSIIDFQRGSSSLQVQDPTMQTQTSTIGVMFNYILIVVFFQVGGLFFFLDAIVESFKIIPIDKMISPVFFNLGLPFWKAIMGLLTRVLAISIQIAAPSIVAILMAEMFLGIANRLAPQVQIVFLGMSLKSLLGLGMLWAGWYFILQQMGKHSLSWIQNIDNLLRSLGI